MKHALLVAALLCAAPAYAQESHWDLVVMGKSWHFGNDVPGATYNNYNPGIGIEYRFPNGLFAGALTYHDSYRKQAYSGYIGYQFTQHVSGPWSVFAAVRAGYLNGSGFHGPMVMPTVGVQYKRLSIELQAIPKIGNGTVSEVGVFARWSF